MTKEKKLSERQVNILKYIADYIAAHTRPPTIREIGKNVEITSTSVVNYNLQRLKERGMLSRDKEVSRGLRLTNTGYTSVGLLPPGGGSLRIQLHGSIIAGEPIPTPDANPFDEDDFVEVSESLLTTNPSDLFALKVSGSSMIDAMVNDGDIVILRQQQTAKNGDMVAALVAEDETTLKYWFYEDGKVRLQPANPTMDPIFVDPQNVQVQGKVEMVIRQL